MPCDLRDQDGGNVNFLMEKGRENFILMREVVNRVGVLEER